MARRDPAQPVARFDRVCRPTGSARRTAAATDTAATSAGRARDGQLLARHDQTGGRETVRGEQGVQRDPMSGGDLAQPIARPHGVPRPAGSARRAAAAGSRNHEALTRQDQAVDRQVVASQPMSNDVVAAADGRITGERALATRRRLLDATESLLERNGVRDLKVVDITR